MGVSGEGGFYWGIVCGRCCVGEVVVLFFFVFFGIFLEINIL